MGQNTTSPWNLGVYSKHEEHVATVICIQKGTVGRFIEMVHGHAAYFSRGESDTSGGFSLLEGFLKPGNEPPPHVHEREDELFYILEGKMSAYVGNEVFNAGAGECLFLPKLKPHSFVVRSPKLRSLILLVPGGLEECFRARSSAADKLELPTGAVTYSTSNLDSVSRAFEKYDVRFLSPDEVAKQMPLYLAALHETAPEVAPAE